MRLALLADVHANLPALEAVLEDVAAQGVERCVCLGDLVGYNAEPAACVTRVRAQVTLVVAGNHDVDCVRNDSLPGTNAVARQVQAWTRAQLDLEALDYLAGLPNVACDPAGFVAAHGCFLNSLYYTGYVTGTMLGANLAAVAARPEWPSVAFVGHTHVPMCGWITAQGEVHEAPARGHLRWPSSAPAVLLNPGSVGQPRDGDPRAAYGVFDPEAGSFEFRRVRYDVEASAAAILAAGLPAVLAERLREGR
jgi:diadenosine tetraphosphatase ApaH/serine/threonine PP2A family protein phosphatase